MSFINAKGTRKVVSSAAGVVVIISLVLTALLFSSSASAMEEAARLERTGGDAVKNYISVPNMIRLAYEEPVYIQLHLEASATSEEIEILMLDEEEKLSTGMPFALEITDPDGNMKKYLDEDCDGKITVRGVKTGKYTVSFVPCKGYEVKKDIEVTVEPPVERKKIDVSDKIIDSGSADTKQEDNQYGRPVRPETNITPAVRPGDTVIYVESSKELVRTDRIETQVTDGSGNPLYTSVPALSAADESGNKYLILNDGSDTVSEVKATVNDDGTLASAQKYVSSTAEDGTETGEWVSCFGEVIGAGGYPVCSSGDTYVYKFSSVTPVISVTEIDVYEYRGWQEINGNTYYYDVNGVPVTGSQIINGESYYFNDEGVRSSTQGIDVSTWNGNIDWNKVKASGIDYVIIRVGFRGYSAGSMYSDNMFEKNFTGAKAAGLKVGIYFFTQAINEREAVEEASMCLELLKGRSLNYPVFIDMEDAGSSEARTNNLSNSMRTTIINAFCDTIRSGGYRAGLYANKYYLTNKIYVSELSSSTRIWIAHYTSDPHPEYQTKYDMWQYSSTGSVPGISGNVDLDKSYM